VPVIALYFLLDSARLRRSLVHCFTQRLRPDVERALDAINRSLSGYIYSRVILAAIIFAGMATAMGLLGVRYWLVLALAVFIGEFIPIVGGVLAFIPIAIVTLVSPEPTDLIWILLINVVLQLVQNYIISPKLVGETMNIHPLTVIIAMLIGGSVGGLAGLVLALPVAAAAKILLSIFVFRREERGITLPKLDLIANREALLRSAETALPDDLDPR
jgi:predicted PurR-regulated permease PerM